MTGGEFKKITDALARFATTRETADGPISLVGVQKSGDTLKFISGHSRAGMVVSTTDFTSSDEGKYSFTVLARPLLQAAKVLPAKTGLTIKVNPKGVAIQTAGGGTFDVSATGLSIRDAGFAPKPKSFKARGTLDLATLKRMSKIFKGVCSKITVPSVQVIDNVGYAVAIAPGNGSQYVNYRFPAENDEPIEGESYNMAGYREFWEALTHFTEDAVMEWGRQGIVVKSGNAECFSAPYLVSGVDKKTGAYEPPHEAKAPPIMVAIDKSDVAITTTRKDLITVVKGQAPFDEHNRVTLTADTGSLRVAPFGNSDGQDVPATTEGKGIRSVNADYLNGLLNAMDSKEVTLRWSGGVPAISISAKDYSAWTILLAPVAL